MFNRLRHTAYAYYFVVTIYCEVQMRTSTYGHVGDLRLSYTLRSSPIRSGFKTGARGLGLSFLYRHIAPLERRLAARPPVFWSTRLLVFPALPICGCDAIGGVVTGSVDEARNWVSHHLFRGIRLEEPVQLLGGLLARI